MLPKLDSEFEAAERRECSSNASLVPAKSQQQPKASFTLPHLKWPRSQTSNYHRGRRLEGSSPPSGTVAEGDGLRQSPASSSAGRVKSPAGESDRRRTPVRDSAGEGSGHASENRKTSVPESGKNGEPNQTIEKSEKGSAASGVDVAGGKEVRVKLCIRIPAKRAVDGAQDEFKTGTEGGEVEESAAKTWNLRPRRAARMPPDANGGTSKVGGSLPENKAHSQQVAQFRDGPHADVVEKKEKRRKFSVSLSRQEIEEDFFAITGSKPTRKPKKRTRTIQKQLDYLFPGLWLDEISPDLYKVAEPSTKG
ncbi:uncharacterized protein LOC127801231 [Diospyros lotus]|uniref:uncharacterized protein LOC127801231 n=1 Tax=Diospyros lotus TaxID=55363 RepID=UPI00225792F9|nr:uncharacterized protein LOC127801231 [Diospyros lotus]